MRKAALITGAAKRLGKAMALLLAELGFDIALHYHFSKTEAEKTQALINQTGVVCHIFQADLSDSEAVQRLIPEVVEVFPELYILVNNASFFTPSDFLTETLESLRKNMEVHFFTPYQLCKYMAKIQQKGLIINILDTNIRRNHTAHFAYLLSKKTLFHLTQQLAVSLAPAFRVNGLAPGMILPEESVSYEKYAERFANSPMQRGGNPQNILQALETLVVNDYINGQVLYIDGGEHIFF